MAHILYEREKGVAYGYGMVMKMEEDGGRITEVDGIHVVAMNSYSSYH